MLEDIIKHFRSHLSSGDDSAHTETNQDMQKHVFLLSDREPSYADTQNADSYVDMDSDNTVDSDKITYVIAGRGRKGEADRQYRLQSRCKVKDQY